MVQEYAVNTRLKSQLLTAIHSARSKIKIKDKKKNLIPIVETRIQGRVVQLQYGNETKDKP